MGRKPIAPGGLSQFNVRLPDELIEELDREVREEQEAHPGRVYTRSDLVREILYRHLAERRSPRRRKP